MAQPKNLPSPKLAQQDNHLARNREVLVVTWNIVEAIQVDQGLQSYRGHSTYKYIHSVQRTASTALYKLVPLVR